MGFLLVMLKIWLFCFQFTLWPLMVVWHWSIGRCSCWYVSVVKNTLHRIQSFITATYKTLLKRALWKRHEKQKLLDSRCSENTLSELRVYFPLQLQRYCDFFSSHNLVLLYKINVLTSSSMSSSTLEISHFATMSRNAPFIRKIKIQKLN